MIPSKVEALYNLYWADGKIVEKNMPSLQKTRERVFDQLKFLRIDHKRILNPTPYKVNMKINIYINVCQLYQPNQNVLFKITVSKKLYDFMHELWLQYTPIGELH